MATKHCDHKFISTTKKGTWKVRVFGTNNRGRISIDEVTTTVFSCSKCGEKKEFPDTWEWNYLAPGKSRTRAVQQKRSPRVGTRATK